MGMKLLAQAFTAIFLTNTLAILNNCTTWPENLPHFSECCEIPYHANLTLERWCYAVPCNLTKNAGKITHSNKFECAARCYVEKEKFVSYDELNKLVIFNETLAKEHYLNASRNISDVWTETIESAFKNFKLPPYQEVYGNTSRFLVYYYKSIDNYLKSHCPLSAIDMRSDCYEIEMQYEKCLGFKQNCSVWPKQLLMPEFCCNYPILVSSIMKDDCRSECKSLTFQRERAICFHECIRNSTSMKDENGKYDIEVVKNLLTENASEGIKWKSSIEISVEQCKKIIEGMNTTDMDENQVDAALNKCLILKLSENCADLLTDDTSCKKVSRFMQTCPETKPERKFI